MRAEHFQPWLNDCFLVAGEAEGSPIAILTLTHCDGLKHSFDAAKRAPFSLQFEGPASEPLQDQIYWLEHPSLGRHPIFLSPKSESQGVRTYEAIFT